MFYMDISALSAMIQIECAGSRAFAPCCTISIYRLNQYELSNFTYSDSEFIICEM